MMNGAQQLRTSKHSAVIALHKAGKSIGDIGRLSNGSKSAIRAVIKHYIDTGSMSPKYCPGRPKVLHKEKIGFC